MGSLTMYDASYPASTEGFQERARDNNVWRTTAHEAELREDRLQVGGVQPGEEKAPGRAYRGLPVLKGGTGKMGRDSLSGSVVIGQGATVLN